MRALTARDFYKNITLLGAFLLEALVYAWFLSALLMVLQFLNRFLKGAFDNDRILYAVLALTLITGQGFVLERLTSGLLGIFRRTQAFISVLLRLLRPHETIIRPANIPGVLVYRFAGPLFFLNATHFAQRVQELIDTADPLITFFLINAEAIGEVDMTGVEVLKELQNSLKSRNIVLSLCVVKGHFREMLSIMPRLADFTVYPSVAAALRELSEERPKNEKRMESST